MLSDEKVQATQGIDFYLRLLTSGSTGTASVYDDRILDQPTGWPHVHFGVESNVYSMILQLTADLKQLSEELRLLKEELHSRPLVSSFLLNDLSDDRIEIAKSISIIVEETDEESLARWPEVNAFGIGSTISEAICDLKNNILDLYFDISSRDKGTLGEIALETLGVMETHMGVKK